MTPKAAASVRSPDLFRCHGCHMHSALRLSVCGVLCSIVRYTRVSTTAVRAWSSSVTGSLVLPLVATATFSLPTHPAARAATSLSSIPAAVGPYCSPSSGRSSCSTVLRQEVHWACLQGSSLATFKLYLVSQWKIESVCFLFLFSFCYSLC